MRRLILFGFLLTLCVAVVLLWRNRFERVPGFKPLHLSDLRSGDSLPPGAEWSGAGERLSIRLQPGAVVRFDFPTTSAVNWLLVRYQPYTSNLSPGKRPWDDGRAMLEWHPPAGGAGENDPVCSVRGNEHPERAEWVMRPEKPSAIPALRLENLGAAGTFGLLDFEAIVVRETLLWKIGRWILMAAFLAWVMAWVGAKGRHASLRSLAIAIVCLLMALYFVVPGPWKSLHPLCRPFVIAGEIGQIESTPASKIEGRTEPTDRPAVLKSVGEIPDKGDLTLRLKHLLTYARTLLHVILLFGPTFLIVWLGGRWPAVSLGGILAVAIEAAQFCFGYGFDLGDCVDLICDAAGIMLALRACEWLKRRVAAFFAARKNHAAES